MTKYPLPPLALLVTLAVQTVWTLLRGPQTLTDFWALTAFSLLAMVISTALALMLWRRTDERVYLIFFLAFTLQLTGDAYLIVLDAWYAAYPDISAADALYLGYYVLMLAALTIFLPTRLTWLQLLGRTLDGMLLAGTAGILLWEQVLGDILSGAQPPLSWLNLAYVLLDLLILGLSVALLRTKYRRRSWAILLLSGGLIAFASADIINLSRHGEVCYNCPLDLLWTWGLALQALALWIFAHQEEKDQVGIAQRQAADWLSPTPPSSLALPRGAAWQRSVLDFVLMTLPYCAVLLACLLLGLALPAGSVRSQGLLWGTLVVVTSATIRHWLTIRDNAAITRKLKESRAKLEHLAYHDHLTDLLNRAALNQFFSTQVKDGEPYAIFSLDLNGFKAINDTHGHTTGDRMLRHAAEQLRGTVPAPGRIFRWGGDEFVVVMPGVEKEDAARALAQNLLQSIERPILHHAQSLSVSSSVGYALGRGPQGYEALLALADQKMYSTKRSRR